MVFFRGGKKERGKRKINFHDYQRNNTKVFHFCGQHESRVCGKKKNILVPFSLYFFVLLFLSCMSNTKIFCTRKRLKKKRKSEKTNQKIKIKLLTLTRLDRFIKKG